MFRRDVFVVARREVRERVRDRGFLLTVVALVILQLTMVAAGGVNALQGEAGGAPTSLRIGHLDSGTRDLVQRARADQDLVNARVEVRELPSREVATELVRQEDLDGAVVEEDAVLVADGAPTKLDALLQVSRRALLTDEALERQSADDASGAPVPEARLRVIEVTPAQQDPERVVALVAMPILFLFIYLFGWYVASGVAEEKGSRVVEIVLSAVSPRALLAGKVLGLAALGLVQLLVLFALSTVLVALVGLSLTPGLLLLIGVELVAFTLGFLFYGALFAVAGALVARQEDLQYTQLPLGIVIVGAFLSTSAVLGAPGSAAAGVLSLLPPVAPLLMPIRIASDAVALWEPVVALVLMVAALAGAVVAADRAYRSAALRFGGRTSLRSALSGETGQGRL